MKDRIARSLFWLVWSRGGGQVLAFLSTLFVARMLSPSDYGLMALAGVWTGAITLLAEMGIGVAIIQFPSMEESELNTCFWMTMGMACAGYVALYVAAPLIAVWFASSMLSDVLRVVGVTLPLTALRIVPDGLLRKRLALDKISQAEIVSAAVTIPVVFSLAWAGAGVWALVAGTLVQPLVVDMVMFWFVRWKPGLQMGGNQVRKIWDFSLDVFAARVFYALYSQADTVILGKVSGAATLGFYSMAMQLAMLPVSKVFAIVSELSYPVMAELQANREALRNYLLRTTRLVTYMTFPMCIGLMLVAEDLVPVLLSEKWRSIVPMFQILCVLALIKCFNGLLVLVLTARCRTRFLCGYMVMLLGVMSVACWAGAVWLGGIGVAIAWAVVYPIVMITMAREALKEVAVDWKMLWKEVQGAVVATLIMAGIVLTVQRIIPSFAMAGSLVRLVLTVGAGGIAYPLIIFLRKDQVVGEIAEVVKWVFHPKRTAVAEQARIMRDSV